MMAPMIALGILLLLAEIFGFALLVYFIWWLSDRVRGAAAGREWRAAAGWSLAWLATAMLLLGGVSCWLGGRLPVGD